MGGESARAVNVRGTRLRDPGLYIEHMSMWNSDNDRSERVRATIADETDDAL